MRAPGLTLLLLLSGRRAWRPRARVSREQSRPFHPGWCSLPGAHHNLPPRPPSCLNVNLNLSLVVAPHSLRHRLLAAGRRWRAAQGWDEAALSRAGREGGGRRGGRGRGAVGTVNQSFTTAAPTDSPAPAHSIDSRLAHTSFNIAMAGKTNKNRQSARGEMYTRAATEM